MPQRQPNTPQAKLSLLALPPEVLHRILASVPLADRLSRVSLACKQLRAACLVPALISDLDVRILDQRWVQRTQALLCFLSRHCQHARSLQLDIRLAEEVTEDSPAYHIVASMVAACLAACAVWQQQPDSAGLRQLSISPETPLLSAGCLPLLRALQQLRLDGRTSSLELRLDGSWRQLTALQDAHLSGCLVCEGEGPALPPSLTRLCIEGDLEWFNLDGLPSLDGKVLAGLPALRCLELMESSYTAASLAAVSGLTALTRLVLHQVDYFPPAEALAALAGTLRVLQLHSVTSSEEVNSTVQALPGLESLALDLGFGHIAEIELQPATLQLPRLCCLCLNAYEAATGSSGRGNLFNSLPAGPYLSSLERLALPLPLAVAAHAVLAQAPQLHTLCLQLPVATWSYALRDWSAFWHFVASHPPLRRLLYETSLDASGCSFDLLEALLLLMKQRPAVEVRRLPMPHSRRASPPACWCELQAALLAPRCVP